MEFKSYFSYKAVEMELGMSVCHNLIDEGN